MRSGSEDGGKPRGGHVMLASIASMLIYKPLMVLALALALC